METKIEKLIFIITYGRSGSTILMKILNNIHGADVKGENGNILYSLFRSYRNFQYAIKHKDQNSDKIDHPWYGVNDLDLEEFGKEISNLFIKTVLKPNEATRISGFKEIQYVDIMDRESLSSFVFFVRKYFKNAYIIFNRRNIDDVLKSGWWKKLPKEKAYNKIKFLDDWMVEFYKAHPGLSYIVSYDDYKDDPEALKGLFDFIEEDFSKEDIAAILNKQLTHLK